MQTHNLSVEVTEDIKIIKHIVNHPLLSSQLRDDFTKDSEISISTNHLWYLIRKGGEVAGVYLIHAHNNICYEVHTALLPVLWGEESVIAARISFDKLFTETICEKAITHVPSYNRIALRYARKCGFIQEGINRKSFMKNNKLEDLILLGICKEEWICQL